MLYCILQRKVFTCNRKEKCIVDMPFKIACGFCFAKKCYSKGFKSTRFGIHDNSYYMKDIVHCVRKMEESTNYLTLHKIKKFKNFFENERLKAKKWLANNPPPESIKVSKTKNMELRYLLLKIAEKSLYSHDLLYMKKSYFDPYKCESSLLQSVTIHILELVRNLRDIYPDGHMNEEQKKNWIYLSDTNQHGILKDFVNIFEDLYSCVMKCNSFLNQLKDFSL